MHRNLKVALLLSGGVDSSVCVHLLQKEGYRVEAFYLKIWLEDELSFLGDCPWDEDIRYAQSVCQQYGVPLRLVSLQKEYWDYVVKESLEELKRGRTPSPDVWCNERVKFGVFYDVLSQKLSEGEPFDKIASGHYAKIQTEDNVTYLCQAKDVVKDQTYFLSRLSQEQLARCLFPLGDYTKQEVRKLAAQEGLLNHNRKDSQGICFLGKIRYNDFVAYHLGKKTGPILNQETLEKLGEHEGVWFHTIGQRKGLGLSGGPWFVSGKDVETNRLFVTHKDRLDKNYLEEKSSCQKFYVEKIHWLSGKVSDGDFTVKLRHSPEVVKAFVENRGESGALVTLEKPDEGIAPGQLCVLYRGERCVGSAFILSSF